MNKDLLRAVFLLQDESDRTRVLCRGETVHQITAHGIKPLLDFLDSGEDFKGFSAADKIVGKAAAFLYVLLEVKEVYAEVLSKSAVPVFLSYGIPYSCGTLTENIINRKGTGLCPMEKAVQDTEEAEEAYEQIKAALEQIKQSG